MERQRREELLLLIVIIEKKERERNKEMVRKHTLTYPKLLANRADRFNGTCE